MTSLMTTRLNFPLENWKTRVEKPVSVVPEPAGFLSYTYGIIIKRKVLLVGGEFPPNPPKNKGNIKECF